MSPKVSRPDRMPDDDPHEADEADDAAAPDLPPGHVPLRPRPRPKQAQRKTLPLWSKIVGYVLLLALTVGVIWYLGRPDDPRSSAQGTAELVATALSGSDTGAFKSYLCHPDDLTVPDEWGQLGELKVLEVSPENEGVATATLTVSHQPPTDLVLLLRDQDDSWCVVAPSLCPLDGSPGSAPVDLCGDRPGRDALAQ